jgi:hypothetical protein
MPTAHTVKPKRSISELEGDKCPENVDQTDQSRRIPWTRSTKLLLNAVHRTASLTDSLSDALSIPAFTQAVTLCGVGICTPDTRHLDDQTAFRQLSRNRSE